MTNGEYFNKLVLGEQISNNIITVDSLIEAKKNNMSTDEFNKFLDDRNLLHKTHPMLNGVYNILEYYKYVECTSLLNTRTLKTGGNPLDEKDYTDEVVKNVTYEILIPERADIE